MNHATEVLNAFTERERRLFHVTAQARLRGRLDPSSEVLVPRSALEIEDKSGTRPWHSGEQTPVHEANLVAVVFGSGRLRFRSQVFEVRLEPLGVAAPECEIYPERGQLIVNENHPSYEDAERLGWSEGVVLRAVATRLACHESSTADEVYALLDEILRFAAGHTRRKRGLRADDEPDLAEAM